MITLGDMFGRFERTAFRCEARPSYLMTDRARFDLWNSGAPLPRKTADNDGWIATIAAAAGRAAVIERIRIVDYPVNAYTRFEFTAFRDNVDAGERISVVERRVLDPSWQDTPDYWLFDDDTVFVQRYDEEGGFLGADQVADVAPFLQARDLLTKVAVPFSKYELRDVGLRRGGTRVGALNPCR